MRIFLSSQQALRQHAVPAYAFWERYFKQGLAEAGHEIIEVPGVDWAEGLVLLDPIARARWLENTWSRTVAFLSAEHTRQPIDFFLGYLFPQQVDSSAIRAIRAKGIPCVNFFCDNVREFTRVPATYHDFDLHWVPEAGARPLYTQAKLPYVYAPMPVWVAPEYRTPPTEENTDTTFLGSHDALREDLLGAAVEGGLTLKIHGDGWRAGGQVAVPPPRTLFRTIANQFTFLRRQGLRGIAMRATYQMQRPRPSGWIDNCCQPASHGEAYFQTTRASQVVIGINRYPSFRHSFSQPGRYSRLRDIEAPMLGTCYLTEWAEGLDDLYDLDREIAVYRTAEELVDQARQLQADLPRRQRLRAAGQRRALSDHTIARSISRIATVLGLPRK